MALELSGERVRRAIFRKAGGAHGEGARAEGCGVSLQFTGSETRIRWNGEPWWNVEAKRTEACEGGTFSAKEVGFVGVRMEEHGEEWETVSDQ